MKCVLLVVSCFFFAVAVYAQAPVHAHPAVHAQAALLDQLDRYDVDWNSPGPNSAASMPLGNGDIGCNVWVDPDGDLLFYISKTDAWGGEKDTTKDEWMQTGGVLMKLGLVRVSVRPNPMAPAGGPAGVAGRAVAATRGAVAFHQVLHLRDGEITITEGEGDAAVHYRIWVDANHPVIRVEVAGGRPLQTKVTLHNWRLGLGDSVVGVGGPIVWRHRNPPNGDPRLADPHLADICFGGAIEAEGLVRKDDTTLGGGVARKGQLISIYASTSVGAGWRPALDQRIATVGRLDLEATRLAHRQWWQRFWERSYVFVHGNATHNGPMSDMQKDATTDSVTLGYVLQRFLTACAGRGAYPIKFNGSIFVVDDPEHRSGDKPVPVNADFRAWGGQYWFQNTRPMYWPRLAAGDFDMMMPLFNMYLHMLPENSAEVMRFYGHGGAYFQETTPFWGTLPFVPPNAEALYTHHYFTPILELSMMMLDYYEYTGDEGFARQYLLPIASSGLEFFDRHFPRDSAGHLLLDPDNSIETYWKMHDPAPDIAGLRAVLTRMLNLPSGFGLPQQKHLPPGIELPQQKQWRALLAILPPLPMDSSEGAPRLLPYAGPQTAEVRNSENPELYAVYPFRLFGPGKPGMALARHSFDIRKFTAQGCWSQDPIEAAMLGYTDIAKADTRYALTRKDPGLKFPAFWLSGNDYKPDEDNGGNGENGLQQMLLQADGPKIFLLPAWPVDWDCDFKLHAPYNTIVAGRVRNGHLTDLVVTPAIRRKDIIDCSLPANNKLTYDIQSPRTH